MSPRPTLLPDNRTPTPPPKYAPREPEASINKLPDDILVIVFSVHYEDGCRDSDAAAQSRTRGLLMVCKRWCNVVMGHAAMWSRLDLTRMSDAQAEQIFKLSRGCKKRVTYTSDKEEVPVPPRILALLSENIDRVAALDFTLANQPPFLSWLANVASSAPILHTLSLSQSSGDTNALVSTELIAIRAKAPDLRHLALVMLRAPWKTKLYRDLTTLRLANCFTDGDLLYGDFYATLRSSPSLEELELSLSGRDTWLPLQDDQDSIPGNVDEKSKVPLWSLRELRLSLPQTFLFHILRRLNIPDDLRVLDLNLSDEPQRWTGTATIPAQLFHPGLLPRTILVDTQSVTVTVHEHSDGIEFTHRAGRSDDEFRVRVSWRKKDCSVGEEVLKTVIEHHPLDSVTSLEILAWEKPMSCDYQPRLPFFAARLKNLVSLRVVAGDIQCRRLLYGACVLTGVCKTPFLHLQNVTITTSSLDLGSARVFEIYIAWLSQLQQVKRLDLVWDPTMAYVDRPWDEVEAKEIGEAMKERLKIGHVRICRLPDVRNPQV